MYFQRLEKGWAVEFASRLQARRRLADKRGAGVVHESLDDSIAVALEPDVNVVALNHALEELAEGDPDSARVVELRCFGGLSIEETAEVMEISPSSVTRLWSFARAWLYGELQGGQSKTQSLGPR